MASTEGRDKREPAPWYSRGGLPRSRLDGSRLEAINTVSGGNLFINLDLFPKLVDLAGKEEHLSGDTAVDIKVNLNEGPGLHVIYRANVEQTKPGWRDGIVFCLEQTQIKLVDIDLLEIDAQITIDQINKAYVDKYPQEAGDIYIDSMDLSDTHDLYTFEGVEYRFRIGRLARRRVTCGYIIDDGGSEEWLIVHDSEPDDSKPELVGSNPDELATLMVLSGQFSSGLDESDMEVLRKIMRITGF